MPLILTPGELHYFITLPSDEIPDPPFINVTRDDATGPLITYIDGRIDLVKIAGLITQHFNAG